MWNNFFADNDNNQVDYGVYLVSVTNSALLDCRPWGNCIKLRNYATVLEISNNTLDGGDYIIETVKTTSGICGP